MSELIHRKGSRGYVVCVTYERPYREYPIYHGPPINPRYANPYFPGTVVPYAEAADWSHGRPKRIAERVRRERTERAMTPRLLGCAGRCLPGGREG